MGAASPLFSFHGETGDGNRWMGEKKARVACSFISPTRIGLQIGPRGLPQSPYVSSSLRHFVSRLNMINIIFISMRYTFF
jgi:hypothetical protein